MMSLRLPNPSMTLVTDRTVLQKFCYCSLFTILHLEVDSSRRVKKEVYLLNCDELGAGPTGS